MSQTIPANYDPSVSGLPGNVGDIVTVAGGATAWVKTGTGVTNWSAFPAAAAPATTATATLGGDNAAISVDVTALGDGDYAWEFHGNVSQAFQQLRLKANGAELTACHAANHLDWIGVGVQNLATTTAIVYDQEGVRTGDCQVSMCGRFSSRNGKLSGFSAQYYAFQSADAGGFTDKQGYASGLHTPSSVLTAIAVAADAGVIRSGAVLAVARLAT